MLAACVFSKVLSLLICESESHCLVREGSHYHEVEVVGRRNEKTVVSQPQNAQAYHQMPFQFCHPDQVSRIINKNGKAYVSVGRFRNVNEGSNRRRSRIIRQQLVYRGNNNEQLTKTAEGSPCV